MHSGRNDLTIDLSRGGLFQTLLPLSSLLRVLWSCQLWEKGVGFQVLSSEHCVSVALRDIVPYAVICRVCPRHGMQIHIQTCTCVDQYTYSYLDMSMSSAVCRWVLLGLSIGCISHPYREQQFSPYITIVRNK